MVEKIIVYYYDEVDISYPDIKPNMYKISTYGDIINIKTGKVLKPFIDKDGYKRIELRTINGCRKFYVHRLVAWEFCNNRDIDLVTNHIDSNRQNNYYTNLEWVTIEYNTRHGFEFGKGKNNRGETHPDSIFNDELVKYMHSLSLTDMTNSQITNKALLFCDYKFDYWQLYRLLNNIKYNGAWKHIL